MKNLIFYGLRGVWYQLHCIVHIWWYDWNTSACHSGNCGTKEGYLVWSDVKEHPHVRWQLLLKDLTYCVYAQFFASSKQGHTKCTAIETSPTVVWRTKLWDHFSNDHTFYLPTCHSSVKVVEFRGSNLVIVGVGTAGKGKGKSNYSCPQSTEGFHAAVALYSNHFVLKWADHICIPSPLGPYD